MIGDVRRLATQRHAELRAQHFSEAREELPEVDARISQAAHEREDVARATLRDDVEKPDVFVLRNQAQRFSCALRRERAVAHREYLIGEAQRVAH